MLNRPSRKDLGKLDSRFKEPVYPGRPKVSDEGIMAPCRSIEVARTYKRTPHPDRWSREQYEAFIGLPSNTSFEPQEAPNCVGAGTATQADRDLPKLFGWRIHAQT